MMQSDAAILVVDDNKYLVDSLLASLTAQGFRAEGSTNPSEILRRSKREDFLFDLILLDMQLGESEMGEVVTALTILPHLMTYAPASRVVVFSQGDIPAEAYVKCLQLGALAIVPKAASVDELLVIADAYRQVHKQAEMMEELIRLLWQDVCDTKNPRKGSHLEMLIINLFRTMPTFKIIGHNRITPAGEIDVLIEVVNRHEFWKKLDSLQLVVECRNRADPAEVADFTVITEKVKSRGRLSSVGVLVSMAGATRGFENRREQEKVQSGIHIFVLAKKHVEQLVRLTYDRREEYLREQLSKQ